jgi:hypothetical protein
MKWLEKIKYKLWWRGITVKDLVIMVVLPPSIIAIMFFTLYFFGKTL